MSRNHKLRPISVLSVGTIGLSLGLFTPHALADEGTPAASTGVERTEKAKTLRRSSRQPLTRVASSPERITWRPLLQNYQSIQLRVTGPGIEPFEASFAEGEPVSFGFYDEEKALWADGLYKWELTANPKIPANTREVMDAIRSESAPIDVNNLLKDTGIVNEDQEMAQSGTFRIVEGKVVLCDPPHRLVHTYHSNWPPMNKDAPTQVTWELEPMAGNVTKVTVLHEEFEGETATYQGLQSGGWAWILSNMKTVLETGEAMPQGY